MLLLRAHGLVGHSLMHHGVVNIHESGNYLTSSHSKGGRSMSGTVVGGRLCRENEGKM